MHTLFENIVVARRLMSQLDQAGGLTGCCSVEIWFCHWTELLWRRRSLMVINNNTKNALFFQHLIYIYEENYSKIGEKMCLNSSQGDK